MTYYTDPACPWSRAAEPGLRRLQAEFGASLQITYVMGGLAREFQKPVETMHHVLDACAASAMPLMLSAMLDVPPAASPTLRLISFVVAVCSYTADAMVTW